MKKLLILLLIASISFSQYHSFSQTVDVKVVDSKGRPIEGAAVTFSCIDCTFITCEKQARESKIMKATNSSGDSSRDIYCYKESHGTYVDVDYQGIKVREDGTWKASLNTFNVLIPNIYDLKFIVKDQDIKPIKDVKVSGIPSDNSDVHALSGTTDKKGEVVFKQIPKNTEFLMRFENGNEEKSYTFDLNDKDADYSVLMNSYPLIVSVMDDINNPISGVYINLSSDSEKITKLTDNSGKVQIAGLAPKTYSIDVGYKDRKISKSIEVDGNESETIVFDIHGPNITNMYVEAKSITDPIYVLADVKDTGLNQVRIYYSLDGTNWKETQVTLTGSAMYRGAIPPQAKDTLISYKVIAKDSSGNSNEEMGTYVVSDSFCPLSAIIVILPLIALFFRRR